MTVWLGILLLAVGGWLAWELKFRRSLDKIADDMARLWDLYEEPIEHRPARGSLPELGWDASAFEARTSELRDLGFEELGDFHQLPALEQTRDMVIRWFLSEDGAVALSYSQYRPTNQQRKGLDLPEITEMITVLSEVPGPAFVFSVQSPAMGSVLAPCPAIRRIDHERGASLQHILATHEDALAHLERVTGLRASGMRDPQNVFDTLNRLRASYCRWRGSVGPEIVELDAQAALGAHYDAIGTQLLPRLRRRAELRTRTPSAV